jgi:6-pyruvoyltetrahydropterin/6-carboxytetrahydropterin synthase
MSSPGRPKSEYRSAQHEGTPVTYELTQRFFFEAAHTLQREHEADASRRIHGHTYRAKVTVGGVPDARSGMVVDLALLRQAIEQVRGQLDHRLLDDVQGLGPATLENLCRFIHDHVRRPDWRVLSVQVGREASGDSCCLRADG